jgi:hypothetical protein
MIRIDEIRVRFTVTLATEVKYPEAGRTLFAFQKKASDGASALAERVMFRARRVGARTRSDERTETVVTEHLRAERGPGMTLPPELQKAAEEATGEDMSGVRLHQASDKARKGKFDAAATGRNIFLGPWVSSFFSPEARAVLFHELTHFVQWKRGLTRLLGRSRAGRELLEQEARETEMRVLDGFRRLPLEAGDGDGDGMPRAPVKPVKNTTAGEDFSGQTSGLVAAQRLPGFIFRHFRQLAFNITVGDDSGGPNEVDRQMPKMENYVVELMRDYAIRREVGEEEFLDDLADRVRALMDEELLIDRERRLAGAPFQYTPY